MVLLLGSEGKHIDVEGKEVEIRGKYRVRATIQVVTNLPLRPKQMLRFSISSSYQNGTFVLMSTGGLSQPEWLPCIIGVNLNITTVLITTTNN